MKKLLTIFTSILLLASCNNSIEFGNLKFDCPSGFKITHQDVDEENLTCMIEDGDETINFMILEIQKEDWDGLAGGDENKKMAYMAYTAYNMLESFAIEEDCVNLSEKIDDWTDIDVDSIDEEDGWYEACYWFDGTYNGQLFEGVVRSTNIDDYRVTVYVQADTEENVQKFLDKIYYTGELKD